ncbi:MAG TPA: hypothetical protein VKT82_20785 [Ktedonobacterales bacterium]|nr:hypothetical protein [Ktedonobacterales bacterium]
MQQPEELRTLAAQLAQIDWSRGLTRNDIKAVYPDFPQQMYLRLPDSKRFSSAQEMFLAARLAPSRAEGDFLGASPMVPARMSVEEGGPPDWGDSPLVTPGGLVDSGSAEDRQEPKI